MADFRTRGREAKLANELAQVTLELKLERQNKFATKAQSNGDSAVSDSLDEDSPANETKKRRSGPVGHPALFRPRPTEYDWQRASWISKKRLHCRFDCRDIRTGAFGSHDNHDPL